MKKLLPFIKPVICTVLCVSAIISFICMSVKKSESQTSEEQSVITVWQVDSFEGGKGSRADFLKKIGEDFSKKHGCYVSVISLTADALRLNLESRVYPDIVSYGAGTYGIEKYINGYDIWCYGGYCFLSLDTNTDFSDVNSENTVINSGKDNFADAAALLCGVNGAQREKSTGAYVKLINGAFKYLLGTQRDIYRLKTRGVSFTVKPVTEYNDLYQNISVLSSSGRAKTAQSFIDYLLSRRGEVSKLGLMSASTVYDDEMKIMQNLDYGCKLISPVSEETYARIKNIISECDINMLKKQLK